MSGEALYERYKDALRRGHVASLRGRLEEALTAYAEAAAIAPERATPHTSAGTALMRRKRPADAVRHYTAAVRLAPRDEAALLGRAQALAAIDRRPQAADAYDAAGRGAGRERQARRRRRLRRGAGLELAEGRERRRTLERLIERLRATEPGEPGRVALERALRRARGSGDRAAQARRGTGEGGAGQGGARRSSRRASAPAEDRPRRRRAERRRAGRGRRGRRGAAAARRRKRPDEASSWPEADVARMAGTARPPRPSRAELEPEPELAVPASTAARSTATCRPTSTSPSSPGRPRTSLERRGEGVALDQLLDLASGYRRDGQADAALDTCYLALSIAPDDVGLHLALVELYDERGWSSLATEKLDLLDRLAALDGDEPRTRRCVAGARGPGRG